VNDDRRTAGGHADAGVVIWLRAQRAMLTAAIENSVEMLK
jgi:hypothetical protein